MARETESLQRTEGPRIGVNNEDKTKCSLVRRFHQKIEVETLEVAHAQFIRIFAKITSEDEWRLWAISKQYSKEYRLFQRLSTLIIKYPIIYPISINI